MRTRANPALSIESHGLLKLLEWLSSLPLLILSATTLALTLLDRLKPFAWSAYPKLPPTATEVDIALYETFKFSILLVSLLAASIAGDRMLHFTRLERQYGSLAESVSTIARAQTATVQVLPNRGEWYLAFLTAVAKSPTGSSITVTAYEKLKMNYVSGEEDNERALMDIYQKRVALGELKVDQIVHVATQDDLNSAWDRVQKHINEPHFTLTVVVGIAPDPLFEYAIIGDDTVLTGFSTQSGSPYAVECGHLIRSLEIADLYKRHARTWSSELGTPLKTRDEAKTGTYSQLLATLPKGHALDLPAELAIDALRAARDPDLLAAFRSLMDSFAQMDSSVPLQYRRAMQLLDDSSRDVKQIASGRIPLTSGLREAYSLVGNASRSIAAVCPEASIPFWQTTAGTQLDREIRLAVKRGVSVTRIIVVDSQWRPSASERTLFDEQCAEGVLLYVAYTDAAPKLDLRDFMIVDDRMVFEDRFWDDDQKIRDNSSLLLIAEPHQREYVDNWELLKQLAEPWPLAANHAIVE